MIIHHTTWVGAKSVHYQSSLTLYTEVRRQPVLESRVLRGTDTQIRGKEDQDDVYPALPKWQQ